MSDRTESSITITLTVNEAGNVSMFVPRVTESTFRPAEAPQIVAELVRDWLDNVEAEAGPSKEQILREHELTNARWNCLRQGHVRKVKS